MAHGGYGKRRAAAERKKPAENGKKPKSLTVAKKPKAATIQNQIRSTERFLRKDLPPEIKEAQEKKLEGLKKQQETQNRLAVELQKYLRNKKIRFFERRKIDRRIRRLEKQQNASSDQAQETEIANQLFKLKEDLEYVMFFPKTEKYVPLFVGGDEAEIVEKRNSLRMQIKANLIAAAASGKKLEETGNEDAGLLDQSKDDFFLNGSSSDEADADDKWTDKSVRELASSASGKATSGMSSDERNQRQISARALMPPPGPPAKPFPTSSKNKPRFADTKSKNSYNRAEISPSSNKSSSINQWTNKPRFAETSDKKSYNRAEIYTPSKTSGKKSYSRAETSDSSSMHQSSFRNRGHVDSSTENSGNLSSNSDARKPKRKRRPKKKKTS
ncbi:hypothetical protein ACJIZ3_013795 [Penstemon smallii]|uniref:rRNA-processing protein EFG1 n=1 Tax=Penstemon smallii TaxID=265156 RepID=A0ABD3RJM7_9LAMI